MGGELVREFAAKKTRRGFGTITYVDIHAIKVEWDSGRTSNTAGINVNAYHCPNIPYTAHLRLPSVCAFGLMCIHYDQQDGAPPQRQDIESGARPRVMAERIIEGPIFAPCVACLSATRRSSKKKSDTHPTFVWAAGELQSATCTQGRRWRTQLSAPALSNKEQSMVIKRHRFKQTHTLQERLAENTEQLLEQAKVLPLGSDRSKIDRRITQNKAAIQLCEMLRSPQMQITK
jgi:hypothetical protein